MRLRGMERHQGNLPALLTGELKGTFGTAVLVEVFRLAAVWSGQMWLSHGSLSDCQPELPGMPQGMPRVP